MQKLLFLLAMAQPALGYSSFLKKIDTMATNIEKKAEQVETDIAHAEQFATVYTVASVASYTTYAGLVAYSIATQSKEGCVLSVLGLPLIMAVATIHYAFNYFLSKTAKARSATKAITSILLNK